MSLIPLGFMAASGAIPESFWITINYTGASASLRAGDIAVDDSFNSYTFAGAFGSRVAIKNDRDGVPVFTKQFTNSNIFSSEISSDGGVILGVRWDNPVAAKMDSSGSLSWQTKFSASEFKTLARQDSSGNVYLHSGKLVAKLDSSGTVVWQRNLSPASVGTTAFAVDSVGNSYVAATISASGTFRSHLIKISSAGVLQFAKHLNDGDTIESLTCDNEDNVIIGGSADSLGRAYVAKLDSGGGLIWGKASVADNYNLTVVRENSISVDSENNVLVSSLSNFDSAASFAKFDSSGNLVWSRTLRRATSGRTLHGWGIEATSTDNVHVLVLTDQYTSGNFYPMNLKIPSDGSLTGTYLGLIYEAAPSIATYTPTFTGVSLSTSASSYSITTTLDTISSITLTRQFQLIG